MTRACFRLVTILLALWAMPALAQKTSIQPRLLSEVAAPAAGSTVTIAIEMRTDKGWHGYWKNPGEAGFAPRLNWTLPKGVTIGEPRYPVPTPLTVAGLMNYVFEADHALLLPLIVPAGLAPGSALPIRLKADWLACTDQVCVPERGEFTLDLKVGDGAPTERARFDAWRAKLPNPLGGTAHFAVEGGRLRLAIPYPKDAAIGAAHFFPDADRMILDAAPQRFSRTGDTLIASIELPKDRNAAVPSGVLALGDGRGLSFAAEAGAVPPDGAPLEPATAPGPSQQSGGIVTILLAIGGALLGGLILNVMPCVFPILSLKALSLAKAGGDERSARRDALAYTAGAVAVCVALGGAILALRAGGTAVGWAFQLQNPAVILALLILMSAMALNLAGLFELPTVGGGVATNGNGFLTGALAAFVATPCTGPFMGAALGAALLLPPVAAFGVFAGLGLGLALPFLLLGFIPALRRLLPKPGAWMVTLRQILSIPMFLTALGLAWLLGRQAGVGAMTLGLAAALLAALGLWWTGLRQAKGKPGLLIGGAVVFAATVLGIAFVPHSAPAGAAAEIASDALKSEPFSETRLAALRASNTPVFVYFTADWCLTCKVNERVAIDQPSVTAAFAKAGVKTLVGDWTRSDAAIGRFLEAQGRSGVPLYLYYKPSAATPEVLPQVLTPGALTALVG